MQLATKFDLLRRINRVLIDKQVDNDLDLAKEILKIVSVHIKFKSGGTTAREFMEWRNRELQKNNGHEVHSES